GPNADAAQSRQSARRAVVQQTSFDATEPLAWTIQAANLLPVVFTQRALGHSRQTKRAVESLAALHRRREHGRMFEAEQVTDLVGERCFEIVSAGRAVRGKLKLGSVFGARLRIDADIGFGDRTRFAIEKDARARRGRF